MLSEHALLSVWEHSRRIPGSAWLITLLAATFPQISSEAIQGMTVVQRDRLLLQLRCLLFGNSFTCIANCPHCHELLEWSANAAELGINTQAPVDLHGVSSTLHRLRVDSVDVAFREPTSADLDSVAGVEHADRALLERCLVQVCPVQLSAHARRVEHNGSATPVEPVSDAVLAQIAAVLQERAQQILPSFELACPGCAERFSMALDIAAYLGEEINTWAGGLLNTVHRLATAYGWTESDVLALSPRRRVDYLVMAGE